MPLEGNLTDAEIKVQNATFPIHKVILSNCSLYFRALFSRWPAPGQTVYTASEYSPEIMQLIIEFAYTNTVLMTDDNVEEIFYAADYYGIAGLIHACITFLEEHLCPQNCINICRLADKLSYAELGHKAYNFLLDHFESCIDSSGFLQLSLEELKDIIKKDELIVREESIVIEAILRWIAHSPNQRNSHIFVLLSKVRLALCSTEYLRNNVLTNALVNSSEESMRIVEAMIHRDPHFINAFARPRFPTAILFATGGWSDGGPTSKIEVYDIRADRWVDLPNSLEETCAYHGTAFLDGSLYCVGGFNGVTYYDTLLRVDLSTRIWHREARMQERRCYVSVCVLNGLIYAMGGHDGTDRLNSAERYDPRTDRWTFIAPMHEQRSDASCAVLNGKVYICGGFNGTHYHSSAEFYNPETDRWTEIAPMTRPRSGFGVVAHGGCIYAVGGYEGTTRLRSAEVYSLDTHRWAPLPSMDVPRSNFGIEVLEDMIVVAGGFDGADVINTVECYNIRAAQWSMILDMGTSRSALSCCVVSGIPSMREYVPVRDWPQDYDMEEDLEEPN
ncbi:kelch-like protein 10 [Thalassophryne amazonica]|uniref:kelch-like protein 10 n=1 Tax=Thalassophryne amazonica TaxID=390379 RepID=UPI0014723E7C|nr:kelch-like protein 10 [Thalassophryne amazonica]